MPPSILIPEIGMAVSSLGLFTFAVLDDIGTLEEVLSKGTSQMILAGFVVILLGCVAYLFHLLMKAQTVKEKEYYQTMSELRRVIQKSCEIMDSTQKLMNETAITLREFGQQTRECHDTRIRLETQIEGLIKKERNHVYD